MRRYRRHRLKADEIGWFPDLDSELLEAWSSPDMDFFAEQAETLKRCLLISNDNGGSGGNWLLHADSAGQDGEWTAYEWWPGSGGDLEPHDTFAALMSTAAEQMS